MKNTIINSILVFFSLLFAFFVLEMIERLRSGDPIFKFQNLISVSYNMFETPHPIMFDNKLGWQTAPVHILTKERLGMRLKELSEMHFRFESLTLQWKITPYGGDLTILNDGIPIKSLPFLLSLSEHGEYGGNLTVLNDGIRSNKKFESLQQVIINIATKPDYKGENRILAVGDSFTFGNEVRNDDTWPSYLEKYSGKPVLNGGVLGYSFGQSILRAELLHDKYQFDTLIVSIIPDDINRDTYSIAGGVPIPYWNIKDDKLILIQNHIRKVPKQNRSKKLREINSIRYWYGYSYAVRSIFTRIGYDYDYYYFGGYKKSNDNRLEIGCKLTKRLKEFEKKTNVNTYLVMNYPDYNINVEIDDSFSRKTHKELESAKFIINCAKKQKIRIIDLYKVLNEIYQTDRKSFYSLYMSRGGHMSPEGNKIVAYNIANRL